MPRYVVIHDTAAVPPAVLPAKPTPGGLDLDYRLPVRHVLLSGTFAFFGSGWFWLAFITVAVILASLPADLARRALPLLLVPFPFGAVPAFRAARQEWQEFTGLVKRSRWLVELQQGRDLDGDGRIGPPQIVIQGKPEPPDPSAEYAAKFRDWVLSLEQRGTAFRDHADLGREEYNRRRDRLMAAGWAEWVDSRNHKAGWRLSAEPDKIAGSIK